MQKLTGYYMCSSQSELRWPVAYLRILWLEYVYLKGWYHTFYTCLSVCLEVPHRIEEYRIGGTVNSLYRRARHRSNNNRCPHNIPRWANSSTHYKRSSHWSPGCRLSFVTLSKVSLSSADRSAQSPTRVPRRNLEKIVLNYVIAISHMCNPV